VKKFIAALFASFICMGVMVDSAEARRLGGSKSFGMQRNSSVTQRPATPPQNAAPAPATAPRTGMSRWLGPIAGLAAGIGLASLLSHFGMGEGVANFLMIALLAMAAVFLLRKFFGKPAPAATQYAGAGNAGRVEPMQFDAQKVGAGNTATSVATGAATGAPGAGNIPADFDVDGFLRQAKLNFVRLQAANDRGDMEDIRLFSTPEVAAEIQVQYQERGHAQQQTDVIQLHADLLDIDSEAGRHVASVRFHGQLREDVHAAPELFTEVWHLVKPVDGSSGWRVAGIQQG
jgi:predicted lipid-binding transport protein (Tim44 family)